MGKYIILAFLIFMFSCNQSKKNKIKLKAYPKTLKKDVSDTYFGTTVNDPYRWLEDDMSKETANWVKQQNEVTFDYLNQITFKDKIKDRLTQVWNFEKYSSPFKQGEYTYFYKNDGLQNHYVLYRQKENNGNVEVFLDPNKFSKDGTTSLSGIAFTKDGSKAVYAISEAGSDWRKLIVLDTKTKTILEDTIKDVKFSGLSWYRNQGFYYSSYDKPKKGSKLSGITDKHKLYYHKLKTPQSKDKLVFGGANKPRRYVFGGVSEDQQFLVIEAAISTSGNELYIKNLKYKSRIIPVVDNFDSENHIVYTKNNYLYILTNHKAPNWRLVKVNARNPKPKYWKEIIPETKDVLSVSAVGGYLFAEYLKDAISVIKQYDLNGKLVREVELPGKGSIGGFNGKTKDKHTYYSFMSYTYPYTLFKYDISSGESTVFKSPNVKFTSQDYISKQVFYTSKDGTKIPMMITYKKGTEMNKKNPTILYGYGGFNISLTPRFRISNIVWLENGGIYAVPNLRGGGEYGEKWHLAGTKLKKQNVFDDFIAAAKYLINNNYTSSPYLALKGGSNGGLLVGAIMTQKPGLAKVALPAVGVLDMLRYHKFTAGAGWAYDYGTSDESKEMFEYLHRYSPYHALKMDVSYPATLITTSDHDDRVVPAHSFKYAARLQEMHKGENPVLIRIETKAGHGAGKPTDKIIEEISDEFAFVWQNMGVNPFE